MHHNTIIGESVGRGGWERNVFDDVYSATFYYFRRITILSRCAFNQIVSNL